MPDTPVRFAFALALGLAGPAVAQEPNVPPDASIGLQRTSCFGPCPVYTVTIDDLKALQEKLSRQDLFEEFCEELTREMNRLRMEHRAGLSSAEREIDRIEARRKKLIEIPISASP